MGNFGVRFSLKGGNVLTDADKDIAFTSKFPFLKLFTWGDLSLTTDGSGDGLVSVAHDLGFAPAFFVFRKGTAGTFANSFWPLGARNIWSDDKVDHALHAYSDADNFYIQANGATASKTYNFRYYILINLAEDFSATGNPGLSVNYGTKISKVGQDVRTAKEYDLVYSTKYKALQYHDVSFKTHSLTLPGIFASYYDDDVVSGTWVDIAHGLGYAPFWLAFFKSNRFLDNQYIHLPFMAQNGIDLIAYEVNGWCDATRVRLSFYREAIWFGGNQQTFEEDETIELKVYIFTENLTGT